MVRPEIVIGVALISFIAGFVGVVLILWNKRWSTRSLHWGIGFGAGLLIGISLLDIIPTAIDLATEKAMVFVLLGFVVATVQCVVGCALRGRKPAVAAYRQALGRTVLIGLEVLVAATIIKTITLEPTFEGISFLAIMVAIRTTLGWTMVLEMCGRWPWQRAATTQATVAS